MEKSTTAHGQELSLSSGYTVFIRPLPPYYKDLIEQQLPMPEYPNRKIKLFAGDEVDWPYEPPKEDISKDHEDYELFVKWHQVDRMRKEVEKIRSVVRVDYLLSMCVDVVDGQYTVEDVEWAERLEAAFDNFKVPEHKGKRYLYFLKHIVITNSDEFSMIISLSTSPEVTMQGIINALRGFQHQVEEGGTDRSSQS